MTRIVNTVGIVPSGKAVTNSPSSQTQQATQKTQTGNNQPATQQQSGFGDTLKMAESGYKYLSKSGIWGSTPAVASGAATGALSASGGTYVTGAGLAGTPGAIHTTAGAAGTSASSGLASGMKGGLASAGAGIIGGFLGGKAFGTKEGATGASTGAAIGSAFGPVGAVLGGIFGGIIGNAFSSNDEPFVQFAQGANLSKGSRLKLHHQQNHTTALGKFAFGEDELKPHHWNPMIKSVKDSDQAVANLMDEGQLVRAKQGLTWFESDNHTAKPKGDRVQNMMGRFFKERYSMALGGLDLDYKGTFNRVATEKNMGGLISTMTQMDRDIADKRGIFADFNPEAFDPNSFDANDIRLQKQISVANPNAGKVSYRTVTNGNLPWGMRQRVVAPDTIMVDNPDYDADLAAKIKQYEVTSGYKYTGTIPYRTGLDMNNFGMQQQKAGDQFDKQTTLGTSKIGNEALQHIANKYDLGERPTYTAPQLTGKEKAAYDRLKTWAANVDKTLPGYQFSGHQQNQLKNLQRKLDEKTSAARSAYDKRLGAWEKSVLDAYVNNYGQGLVAGGADNLVNMNISRTTSEPVVEQPVRTPEPEQPAGLLQQARGQWEGGVVRHRANSVNRDAVNAVRLRERG